MPPPRRFAPTLPFQGRDKKAGSRIPHREGHHETKLRQVCSGCRVRQQEARIEISRLGYPGRAAAAPPCGLPRGGDPQRPGLASAPARERLRIGRAEGVVSDQSDAGCFRIGMKLHQNSDFAAAVAAVTSGEGQTMNNIMRRPLTPSTTFSAPGIGSKAAAGSSKYITLTIER